MGPEPCFEKSFGIAAEDFVNAGLVSSKVKKILPELQISSHFHERRSPLS
jgi:hypothetical protein